MNDTLFLLLVPLAFIAIPALILVGVVTLTKREKQAPIGFPSLMPGPATRWQRLRAATVDGILSGIPALIITKQLDLWNVPTPGVPPTIQALACISAVSFACYVVLNFHTLRSNGQSIGKLLIGIKIVDGNNQIPSVFRLLALRQLPLFLMHPLPFIGRAYSIVDALFIFKRGSKCLHDVIAGTIVVKS